MTHPSRKYEASLIELSKYLTWLGLFIAGTFIFLSAFSIISQPVFNFGAIFSMSCLSLGQVLILYFNQTLWRLYRHSMTRFLMICLHTLFGWLAIIQARAVVSRALQLPVQDFDSTVGLFAIISYVLLWPLLISAFIGIFGFWTFMKASFYMMLNSILNFFLVFLNIFRKKPIKIHLGPLDDKTIKDSLTLFVALICASFYTSSINFMISHARQVAYQVDYFSMTQYPCLESGEKVILHENGIISKAKKVDGGVQISVENYSCHR